MKTTNKVLLLVLASVVALTSAHDGSIYQLHGSGTTNPSKCFWLIMEQFMDRAKVPLRMTYRAVGSSTGQAEFKGSTVNGVANTPSNDFGSGDIPISSADYKNLTDSGIQFVQLPFVLGAISVFHSVPGVPDGAGGLNLTSCLLARIFSTNITAWDHPDIVARNPGLGAKLPYAGYEIKVAHRRLGSSSTASLTAFLHEACPGDWPQTSVGKTITWPSGTLECEGSAGMTKCIRDTPGTIGYIDSGHGHSEGLVEIELQNRDGSFLSSKEAGARGGIGAAAGAIPASADADFGGVDLLNQPGPDTWPIVTLSYVYVRKDLSFIDDPSEQSLLTAFLRALYDSEYIDQCAELFGFTTVPTNVRDVGLGGINMLQVAAGAPMWTFETSIQVNIGQGNYVISKKRRTYAELTRSANSADVSSVMEENSDLRALVSELRSELAGSSTESMAFTSSDQDQLNAALILSSISLVLSVLAGAVLLRHFMCGGVHSAGKPEQSV